MARTHRIVRRTTASRPSQVHPAMLPRWVVRLVLGLTLLALIAAGGCGGIIAPGPLTAPIAEACGLPTTNVSSITPNFECIAYDDNGDRHAIFSYSNSSDQRVVAGIDGRNVMSPAPAGRGQPGSFGAGPSVHVGAFAVPMPESTLVWRIGFRWATATSTSDRVCETTGGFARLTDDFVSHLVDLHASSPSDISAAILPTDRSVAIEQRPLTAGKLTGEFSMGPDGSAHYSIPFWVPPGRAGIQPNLGLGYSSEAGDGPLGVGFGLSGLSQITRCPKTLVDDKTAQAIDFDDAGPHAKFCLDGDALDPVANDGVHATSYRTRHESYKRITIDGFDDAGPTSFTVETKGGQILRYGTRADSSPTRLESMVVDVTAVDAMSEELKVVGGTLPPLPISKISASYTKKVRLGWSLSEVSDRAGNAMLIDYELRSAVDGDCSTANAACAASGVEQLPAKFSYTWLGRTPGKRSVVLVYEPRPTEQVSDRWIAGFHLANARLLTRIEMFGPDPDEPRLLRSYSLAYEASPDSGRPRLHALLECDRGDVCRAPTTFGYNTVAHARHRYDVVDSNDLAKPDEAATAGFPLTAGTRLFDNNVQADPNGEVLVLDINGDGLDDILYRVRRKKRVVAGKVQRTVLVPMYWYRLSQGETFAEPQEAGLDEVAVSDEPSACEKDVPATPAETFLARIYQKCMPPMPRPLDVDMDGTMELHDGNFLYRWSATSGYYEKVRDKTKYLATNWNAVGLYVADLDGDNFPELVPIRDATDGFDFYSSSSSGGREFDSPPFHAAGHVRRTTTLVTDWNGNGRHGLLAGGDAPRYQHLDVLLDETGYSYSVGALSELIVARGESRGVTYLLADLNGDGLDEAVEIRNGRYSEPYFVPDTIVPGNTHVNTGKGFLAGTPTSIWGGEGDFVVDSRTALPRDSHYRVLDENGDGRSEIWGLNKRDSDDGLLVGLGISGADLPPISKQLAPTGYSPLAILDMNGDGAADILKQLKNDEGYQVFLSDSASTHRPDLLSVVNDVGRFDIAYSVSRGRADDAKCSATTVVRCLVRGRSVVSAFSRSLGATRLAAASVAWNGGIYRLEGQGFLGFAERKITDLLTGAVTETTFDNSSNNAIYDGFSGRVLDQHVATKLESGRVVSSHAHYEYEVVEGTVPNPFHETRLPLALNLRRVTEDVTETTPSGLEVLRSTTTTAFYDSWGNVIRQDVAGGGLRRIVQTAFSNDETTWVLGLPTRVDSTARSTDAGAATELRSISYTYDEAGRVKTRTIAPEGTAELRLTTTFTYDPWTGLLVQATDKNDVGETRLSTSVMYDPSEGMFPETITDALGHVRRQLHHPGLGVVVQTVDANGVATKKSYDGFGRPRRIELPTGAFADTHYLVAGSTTSVITTNTWGHVSTTRFDEAGRMLDDRLSGALEKDSIVEVSYDGRHPDRPHQVTQRHFVGAAATAFDTFTYDALGRPLSRQHADKTTAHTTYDGLVTHAFDEAGDESILTYDVLGRLVESAQVKGYDAPTGGKPHPHLVTTHFLYTPMGELLQALDGAGNSSARVYDARGRVIATSDPDTGYRTVRYDAFGSVLQTTDGAGSKSSFANDVLGRMVGSETKDGFRCYEYDTAPHGIGRLAASVATGDDVRTELAYDTLGRPIEQTWTIGGERFSIGARYGTSGRIDALIYPSVGGSRPEATFTYDPRGLSLATFFSGELTWQADVRDASLAVTQETIGNGLTTIREFDPVTNRLKSLQTGVAGATGLHDKVQSWTFGYSPDGNVVTRTDAAAGYMERFAYDGLDELTEWESAPLDPGAKPEAKSISVRFAYDDLGNLLTRSQGAAVESFGIGEGGRGPHTLTSVSSMPGSFAYDGNGNQTASPTRPSVTYTAFNLPRELSTAAHTLHFTYDAANRRVRKQDDSGAITTTVGPYERRVDASGTTHVFHVPGGAVAVWREHEGIVEKTKRFLHSDGQSVQLITDGYGNVIERRRYEPFGRRVSVDDPTSPPPASDPNTRAGYTGQPADDEVDLVDMRGRVYDPRTARFLTPDPYVTAPGFAPSWNHYGYVWNNPVNLVDPTGFAPNCDELSASCNPISTSVDGSSFGGGGSSGYTGYECNCTPTAAPPPYKSALTTPLPSVATANTWTKGNVGGDNTTGTANGNDNKLIVTNYEANPTITPIPQPPPPPTAVPNPGDDGYEGSIDQYLTVNGYRLAREILETTLVIEASIASAGLVEAAVGAEAVVGGVAALGRGVTTLATGAGGALAGAGKYLFGTADAVAQEGQVIEEVVAEEAPAVGEELADVATTVIERTHDHHIFPLKFVEYWNRIGLNYNLFTARIPIPVHQALHSPPGTGGGYWNNEWQNFLTTNPSLEEVYERGFEMSLRYGLGEYPIVPYRF
jgi:RHS repeat-associated protein